MSCDTAAESLASYYGQTLYMNKTFNYCPGCGHGIVTRLVAEALEDMGLRERAISVVGIGCGGFSHHYLDIDAIEAMHGRAVSVASGYKFASPENVVFTYQGDGDMSAIGLADLLHAANKGTPICAFMINNVVFGMTGGQMSPTTLPGQVTATTVNGRDPALHGYPLLVPETMRGMEGVKYLARESIMDPASIRKAAKSVRRAFEVQLAGSGFAFIEFLSPCPTGLKKSVVDSYAWGKEHMTARFKPQVFKDEKE